jgi:hypothetical protein
MQHLPAPTAQSLADVQALFAIWRKNKKHRRRIPEDLWTAAVVLHHEYSVNTISKFLSLSYTELKKRIQLHPQFQDNYPDLPKQFVPIDLPATDCAECIVEMEHCNGNKMRMHFKCKADLDIQSFAESFWRERA